VKVATVVPAQKEGRGTALVPWLTLLFLGSATLGAWLLIGPLLGNGPYYRVGWNRTAYEFGNQVLVLFIPWALALFAWYRGARVSLRLLLVGALILHVLVLFAPPPQSQDFFQYLFYGRMQAVHGANPFVADPSLFWADRWFPWIRWNTQASVYGPAWILLTFSAVKVAGNNLAVAFATLKLAVLAMDVAIMFAIVALAKDRPDPQRAAGWGLLAYAWNPLVLMVVPLAGSADVAVACGFALAFLAHRRGRPWLATVLLTLAALVKVYALIGIVLYLVLLARQRGGRRAAGHAALATGLAALAYAPYWTGLSTFKGLFHAAGIVNTSLAGTVQRVVFAYLFHVAGFPHWYFWGQVVTRVLAGALLLAAVVWAIRRCRDEPSMWMGALGVLVAYVLLTPWFLYWYILTPLVLVAVLPRNRLTYPLLVFSATTWISMALPTPPMAWIVLTLLRYGPAFAVYFLQSPLEGELDPASPVSDVVRLPSGPGRPVPQSVPAAR
jgi:Glycosyltransferase family 87